MQDSKFWRIMAVLTVTTLLYVGHSLYTTGTDGGRVYVWTIDDVTKVPRFVGHAETDGFRKYPAKNR